MKKGKAIKGKVKKREEENIINGKINKEKKIRDKGRKCIVRKCSHSQPKILSTDSDFIIAMVLI